MVKRSSVDIKTILNKDSGLNERTKEHFNSLGRLVKSNLLSGKDAFLYMVIKVCLGNGLPVTFTNKEGEVETITVESSSGFYLCEYLNTWVYKCPKENRYTLEELLINQISFEQVLLIELISNKLNIGYNTKKPSVLH